MAAIRDQQMRTWGFQAMLVVSGSSKLETTATKELLRLVASEPQLASWSRTTSFRVVTRADVAREALAAAISSSMSASEEPDAGGDGAITGDDAREIPGADAQSPDAPAPLTAADVVLTPRVLADAFQRLVRLDRDAHAAAQTQLAAHGNASDGNAGPSAATTDAPAQETKGEAPSAGPLAAFAETAAAVHGGSAVTPARIYLLDQYPASLAEMQALLRTGEVGCAFQGELPLLPLIDGVLLVADPTRELREGRRKSIGLADERRKSAAQRQPLGAIAADGAPVAASEEAIEPTPTVMQSVFLAANALVRESYEASSVGGLEWSDFVFADVPCTAAAKESKGVAELAKELLTSAETLAAHKYEFKHWVSTTKMIPIPATQSTLSDDDASAMLKNHYEQILRGVYEASVGVSTVLFAMKEAVVLTLDGNGESCSDDAKHRSNQSYVEEFITHGDAAALRLAVAYATFVKEQREADFIAADPCSVLGRRVDEIEKEMWALSDLPGVGNAGRKGMPVEPLLTHIARSVLDTEFRTFSPFDVAQVHLTRQVQRFEEVLGESWKGKLQRTRCFVEELDRSVLPQRLAQILGNFPAMYKDYYAATDSLLVATLAATAPGRFRTTTWSAKDQVRHRPAFKDWRKERLLPDEYMTPRTRKALDACVPLSSSELALVSEKISILFPSDQSVIRVYQTPRGYTWLNVYQGGDVFGFRQIEKQKPTSSQQPDTSSDARHHRLQFCASFGDSSQLHICEGQSQQKKPDGFPTISASNTFPNGLTVTACSDGSIVQRYDSTASSTPPLDREIFRLILGKGTVVRQLAGGERTVLLSNGDVSAYKHHEHDDLDGKPIRVVDPATNALVEKRANGVVVVTRTDGSRATYHVDGTCMFTNSSKTHVLVKKAGFADVCIDIAVNLAAQRHARGERVAVTKGGLRTRSTVDVYDGTRIEVGYNTKVIAQVNGRVTVRKPSGVCVVAKDSGRIEYQPPSAWAAPPRATAEDADLNVTSHRGVYYFDNALGRFELCDHEENRFAVDLSDKNPRISVDLAGVVSDADAAKYEVERIPAKAVVNDPIEPHLLILNGDGTGCELLRPRDIEQYLRLASSDLDSYGVCREMSSGQQQQQQQQQHRVFFEELQCPRATFSPGCLFDDPELHAEMQRVAKPVNAAAKYLERFYLLEQPPSPQFTVVRKIQQIRPLSFAELDEMHAALQKWRDWQHARELNKDQYKVEDPRDADTIAQHAATQKKVVAAYKAARSRKKLERMRARELKRQAAPPGGGAKMETVQEGDEPHADEREDGDSSDDGAFDYSSGDDSDASGGDLGDNVDDPAELLWTAFADADTANAGRLSVTQTRQALVHVLGVGVSTAELLAAFKRFKLRDYVGFDSFVELVGAFRDDERSGRGAPVASVPALKGLKSAALCAQPSGEEGPPRALAAAGSAADAIKKKARQQQEAN